MNIYIQIISGIIVSAILLGGCDKDKEDALGTLKSEADEIQKIAERSEMMQSEEDAFYVMKDLNQSMKSVRDACIGLDGEFLEMTDSLARKNLQQEFSGINNRINQSLHTISENIQPYSGDKRVEELLEKLNEVLISR